MPFRDLILFHLAKILLTENKDSIKTVLSLCRGFNIDLNELIVEHFGKHHLKKFSQLLCIDSLLPELSICFPDNIIHELIHLRLCKFYKTVKPSYKLTTDMKGIVFVKNRTVYVLNTNDPLIDFMFKEYNPCIYTYTIGKPDNLSGYKIILCGYDKITFFTYLVTNITSNKKIDVIVTEKCLISLLQPENVHLLKQVFNNGHDRINKVLKHIYYSILDGGHTPNGAFSITSLI
ncbi:SPV048 putative transcriptional elongation factor [Swinepox virus]|uniref:Late transcription elongation factor OPG087 n=1 Tax=Swinepox virus (strain Swine/Nebraska/17077-99/1999) TaxID=300880 RepID=Q8V3P5_SWPV1|nr:transcriptional elongation factor [Swinepox virus]AAL69788.1 SPV048 putative transcriptional elongation factor [Swinepox virus]UED36614.1 transcriptional elongation factor [Swinepox virus]UED36763.1 transcriptional elongation factor [Swinepox virus]UUA44239.1 SPV048 [Swinepox virus]